MTRLGSASPVVAGNLLLAEVRQNPYPFYRELRRYAPVCGDGPAGSYLVSRYGDVLFVLKNASLFSSSIMDRADQTLLGADPPAHTRIRRIVNRAFSLQRMAALVGRIRMTAELMVQQMIQRERSDLMLDLAIPLPLQIIAEMLGIEPQRHADLKGWSEAVVMEASGIAPHNVAGLKASVAEFNFFFHDLIERRRQAPAGDLISALMHCEDKAESLTAEETWSFAKLLLIAGNETTTNLIGNSMLALLAHPTHLAKVQETPSHVDNVIEETLRYDTPVQFVQRRTTQDVELSGTCIPAHASVIALLGSANRDERQFNNPDRFDPERRSNDNLAFGSGPHFCLGASLARQEATIALEVLLSRMRDVRAAESLEEVPRITAMQLRGPARLILSHSP